MRCTLPFEWAGDPRICMASIIWINPDSTTWIRSPCKSHKGELAVDVTLEKSVVKRTGDAWRIIMDSCLPVLHLIDTRRSIPYAIKQTQELLGISCAFDQAVQVFLDFLYHLMNCSTLGFDANQLNGTAFCFYFYFLYFPLLFLLRETTDVVAHCAAPGQIGDNGGKGCSERASPSLGK